MDSRIEIQELKKVIVDLPVTYKSYEQDGVRWDIFVAKKLYSKNWENQSLHDLVRLCRRSFLRYGAVPLEDAYDNKAMVLLARVRYPLNDICAEEWLSIRFIPASGEPYLSEDLQLKLGSGPTFYEIINDKLFFGSDKASDFLLTISRICGIEPYDRENFNFIQKRLEYTALTSSLVFLTMTDILQSENRYQYITAMFNQNIFRHIKEKEKDGKIVVLDLPNAHEILNLPEDYFKHIKAEKTAYSFPTYFFNLSQLIKWLEKIVAEGSISVSVINKFLVKPIDWREIDKKMLGNKVAVLDDLNGLGGLFSFEGKLEGSKYTGKQLREELEREVDKSFSLKLFSRNDLRKKLKLFLQEFKFSI